jgi:hypothetical protein
MEHSWWRRADRRLTSAAAILAVIGFPLSLLALIWTYTQFSRPELQYAGATRLLLEKNSWNLTVTRGSESLPDNVYESLIIIKNTGNTN